MSIINPQAEELNQIIQQNNPTIYNLLSEKGRAIFFPKSGILAQTADAKETKYNATIGMATEDNGKPMKLTSISDSIHLESTEIFPYAPSYGLLKLRKIWQQMIKEKNPNLKGQISLPISTVGLTHAVNRVGYLFVNPGDKIILTDKYWGNYKLTLEHDHGGVLTKYNTFQDGGFDLASLKEKLNEGEKGKRILLLNFPNNPTGYTPTEEEAEKIAQIINECAEEGNEILVILDDAYFGLVYEEGIYKESLFVKLINLHENILTVKLDGITKEDYAWGLRVGFITYGCKDLTEELCEALESKTAGAIRGNISNASRLCQSLAIKAFESETYLEEKKHKYQILKSRFEKVQEVLKESKYAEYFTPLPHNSGYFMCIELKEGLDAEKMRQVLLKEYDTGVIALGNLLRIAYSSLPENDIAPLFENIYQACKKCHSRE